MGVALQKSRIGLVQPELGVELNMSCEIWKVTRPSFVDEFSLCWAESVKTSEVKLHIKNSGKMNHFMTERCNYFYIKFDFYLVVELNYIFMLLLLIKYYSSTLTNWAWEYIKNSKIICLFKIIKKSVDKKKYFKLLF